MNASFAPRPQALLSAARAFAPVSSICRCFSTTPSAFARPKTEKEKIAAIKQRQKRKRNVFYKSHNISRSEQYALCDAIQ